MKKTLLLLLLLSLLLLSGCGCSHEWVEADCLSPKTCALCGETEGEALGHCWQEAACETPKTCTRCGETDGEPLSHTWQEATCEAPEVCTRCGDTQGESLPHSFGRLERSGDTMFHTCGVCGLRDQEVAFDLDAFLQENLVGKWIRVSTVEGNPPREYIEDSLAPSTLIIKADGTFAAELVAHITGTWTYRETTENDGVLTYCFDLHIDGEREDRIHSLSYSEDAGVTIVRDQVSLISTHRFQRLSPELKAAEPRILGTWNSALYTTYRLDPNTYIWEEDVVSSDTSQSITFFGDGTLTAHFLGEKTGTWFCIYAEENQWSTLCTYQLQFDGEDQVYNGIYSTYDSSLEFTIDQEDGLVSYTFYLESE